MNQLKDLVCSSPALSMRMHARARTAQLSSAGRACAPVHAPRLACLCVLRMRPVAAGLRARRGVRANVAQMPRTDVRPPSPSAVTRAEGAVTPRTSAPRPSPSRPNALANAEAPRHPTSPPRPNALTTHTHAWNSPRPSRRQTRTPSRCAAHGTHPSRPRPAAAWLLPRGRGWCCASARGRPRRRWWKRCVFAWRLDLRGLKGSTAQRH